MIKNDSNYLFLIEHNKTKISFNKMAQEMNHEIFVEYDWKTFMDSCSEMFSTEFYGCEYPLFQDYIDSYGLKPQTFIEFIEKVISETITGEENIQYQKCLDDIIDICLEHSRYSKECIPGLISSVIHYLLAKETSFPFHKLFVSTYIDENNSDNSNNSDSDTEYKITLQDEIVNYRVRGIFIDEFYTKIPIDSYNWSNIVALDEAKIDLTSSDFTDETRLGCLKFKSKYLRTTYINLLDHEFDEYYY
jgi:hypothetical protein